VNGRLNDEINTKVKTVMSLIILPVWMLLNLRGSGAFVC
jgi:hypothetical protein